MSHRPRETVLRATTAITIFLLVGKLGGLVREMLMVRSFSVRDGLLSETDAFISALWLNMVLYSAWQHAIPHTYIPAMHRLPDRPAQKRLLLRTLAGSTGLLLGYILLLALNSTWIAHVMAGGTLATAEQVALTRRLLLLTSPVGPLMCLGTVVKCHLNGLGRFTWPGFAQLPYSFAGAVAIWLFAGRYGIDALAIGTVAGAAAYPVLVLLPLLVGPRSEPEPTAPDSTDAVDSANAPKPRAVESKSMWRGFAAYFGSGIILEMDFLLLLIAARHLSPGYPTLLYLSMQLFNIFVAPIDKGFCTSVFAHFSHHLHSGDGGLARARLLLTRGVTALMLVSVAVSALSFWIAQPLAALLFQRGEFGLTQVQLMGVFAPVFFLSFFPAQGGQLVERLLAAVGRTRAVFQTRATYMISLAIMVGVIVILPASIQASATVMRALILAYVIANLLRLILGWRALRRADLGYQPEQRLDVWKGLAAILGAIVVTQGVYLAWRAFVPNGETWTSPDNRAGILLCLPFSLTLAVLAFAMRLDTVQLILRRLRPTTTRPPGTADISPANE